MKHHIICIIVAVLASFFIFSAHAQGWGRLSKVGEAVQKNEYIIKAAAAKGVAGGSNQP